MLLHRTLNNTYVGRPCFVPWQDFDIAYDAILDIRITVEARAQVNLFLSYYKKEGDTVSLSVVTDTGEVVATLHETITEDIQAFTLTVKAPVVYGNVTLSKTAPSEYSDKRVQISPMCIVHQDNSVAVDIIRIDGVPYIAGSMPASCFSTSYIQADADVRTPSHLILNYRNELIQQTVNIKIADDTPDNYIITWDNNALKYDRASDVYYVEIEFPKYIIPYKQNGNTLYVVSIAKKACEYTDEIVKYQPADPSSYIAPEKSPVVSLFVKANDEESDSSDSSDSENTWNPPEIDSLPSLEEEKPSIAATTPKVNSRLKEWVYEPSNILNKLFEQAQIPWNVISIKHDVPTTGITSPNTEEQ